MQFALTAGLQIRRGNQILQLVRELDDGQELHFEDVQTKRPSVLRRAKVIKDILNGRATVVWSAGAAVDTKGDDVQEVVDVATLPEKVRERVEYRLGFLRALTRHRVRRGQRDQVSRVLLKHAQEQGIKKPPSASAVMEWARRYQSSGCNPAALIDRHQKRKTPKRVTPQVEELLWKVLRQHYFTQKRYTAKFAYQQLEKALKREVSIGKLSEEEAHLAYPTFCRRIQDVDKYHRIASREGHSRARHECRTTFSGEAPSYPYQRIEVDHTPLNWVVICDRTGLPLGRPTLTVALDSYSAYPVGMYVSFYGPGVTSLSGVIRSSLMPKADIVCPLGLTHRWLGDGLADEFVVDNGLEFHSFAFKSMAMALGSDITYARVRTPWIKPHVERFFGTLNTLTLMRGRVEKVKVNMKKKDPYQDASITFSDLIAGLIKFMVDVYPHEPNWRKMSTPSDLFQEGLERMPPALFPGNLHQIKLASGMSKELRFSQGGIELYGLPYGSIDFKRIANRYGNNLTLLCKWDPNDMGRIYVRDPKSSWHEAICRWPHYADGLSFNQHKLIRKHARAHLLSADRQEALVRSREELHEHWLNSTRGRNRADSLLAGRYSGFTSHTVLHPSETKVVGPEISPVRIVTADEADWLKGEVPSFASYVR